MSEFTTLLKCCNKCGDPFPATPEYFHRNSIEKDGLCRTCKGCAKARARQWSIDNAERASARHKLNYQVNQEKIKARSAQRYLNHTEEINEKARERHQRNKESDNANMRQYRLDHIEEYDQRAKAWVTNNPERRRAIANHYGKTAKGVAARLRRRARERGLPDTFTHAEWSACLRWWRNACAYCGDHKPLSVDHFIPLASDDCPGTVAENMLPACKSCNSSKMDRDSVEWLESRVSIYEHPEILGRIAAYFDIL